MIPWGPAVVPDAMKESNLATADSEPSAPNRMRILICDDQKLVRVRIREMLEQDSSFVVIAEATGGHESVRLASRLKPDLVLMDVTMPDMDGAEATRQILARMPEVCIVAFSANSNSASMSRMFAAGARGYLLKSAEPAELLVSLHRVLSGNCVISSPQTSPLRWVRPD
jgi:DNA-binding NarL/FixJ family response regulator